MRAFMSDPTGHPGDVGTSADRAEIFAYGAFEEARHLLAVSGETVDRGTVIRSVNDLRLNALRLRGSYGVAARQVHRALREALEAFVAAEVV